MDELEESGITPGLKDPTFTLRCLLLFARHVLKSFFFEKKGLILAGAVAYNTLLSMIPLLVVVLVVLSYLFEEERLVATVSQELALVAPGQAETLTEAIQTFLDNRDLVGWIGAAVLLFLSSIAFRILEDAIALVFKRPSDGEEPLKRKAWVSFLIPYAYMLVMGVALMVLTGLTAIVQERAMDTLLYVAGMFGLVALFTSIYKVLPVRKISIKRAIVGGVTAAILWEITRRILTWYFVNLSLVDVVYGSIATVIIVLVSLEIGAVILLLGAEVIAELEDNALAGLPWYGRFGDEVRARTRKLPRIKKKKSEPAPGPEPPTEPSGSAQPEPEPEPEPGHETEETPEG